jgi:tetratricopeptide (TPR) repeat protein
MTRTHILPLLILLALSLTGAFLGDPLHEATERGNERYAAGELDEALKCYTDAQLEAPECPELHYNIGVILYRREEYEKAKEEFEQSLRSDRPEVQARAYYNLGNISVQTGDPLTAIDYYKRALQLDPDDEDAKYNLELVRRLLKSGPSEKALEMKKEILELVQQQRYAEAWERTQLALESEPTFVKLGDFIQRVRDLAEIFAPESVAPPAPPTPEPTPAIPVPPTWTPTFAGGSI